MNQHLPLQRLYLLSCVSAWGESDVSLRELKRLASVRMKADESLRRLYARQRWLKADNDRKMRKLLAHPLSDCGSNER